MNKVILAGTVAEYYWGCDVRANVFVRIKYADGRLSITGVVGPLRNGDAIGSCGQILETLADPTFRASPDIDVARLADVWKRWHLNDMKAGCEHQHDWNVSQCLTVQELTWGPAYHDARRRVESGAATAAEYAEYSRIVPMVQQLTSVMPRPKHSDAWGAEGAEMLAAGYVVLGKTEQRPAGHVRADEHPDGLMCTPCPTCGYRYGTAWKREDVPAEVLAFLASLPNTPITPAWG